ncbi:NADPH-dependent oxidoreductase [Pseudorhizobium endolithicum]|uniref:NADPH-dependent oxidoreductase n=1 Tax=Pseudorhizobium endolithicum TaxID=1191678 RepID=A0ABM8PLM9_9HYPH|nr:NAD(P)H-dependent oxidoreductase [Pseudorhizobium endolithicum]CAD7036605.1 NADPH-dependent oxidoreductase [Pseudorhizobium endolithicum]
MSDKPIHLAILVGSNREGRLAPTVTEWFIEQIPSDDSFSVDVIDLAKVELPVVISDTPGPEAVAFCQRLADADAFVFVVPEYNHSFPAILKHAIDFGYQEWQAKPVGFVSYGGFGAGLRAVEHLRGVMAELHTVTMRDTVSFRNAWDVFDDHGRPIDPASCAGAATAMLHQLKWWATALRRARAAEPYTAAPSKNERGELDAAA